MSNLALGMRTDCGLGKRQLGGIASGGREIGAHREAARPGMKTILRPGREAWRARETWAIPSLDMRKPKISWKILIVDEGFFARAPRSWGEFASP